MESLTLTSPQTVSTYQIVYINMNWPQALIQVAVQDAFNKKLSFQYSGTQATSLMIALNKANLSTTSLHSRVLQQLVSDGFLPAGSVTGTPD